MEGGSILKITKGRIPGAKKVVIYGVEGIGKSSFAACFPDPVFIDTEDSTKDLDVARFDKPTSWPMLLEEVKYVIANPDCCRTLVLDTADWAEQLEIKDLIQGAGDRINGIEDFGYGKGYTYSAERFGTLLNLLSDVAEKGINVVITAHAVQRKVEQPEEMGAYDHWEMKTSKKVAPMIREWADCVFFANYKIMVVNIDNQGTVKGKNKAQGGRRVMYTTHTPFWDGKNRYGLSEELPLDYDAIRHIIEGQTAAPKSEEPVKAPARKSSDAVENRKSKAEPEPDEEVPVPAIPEPDPAPPLPREMQKAMEAGKKLQEHWPEVQEKNVDTRIPKRLRDLMLSNNLTEWDVQNVIAARLPGAFPPDMPVRDLPDDFIDEWLLKYWEQVVKTAKEMMDKEEIPFQ